MPPPLQTPGCRSPAPPASPDPTASSPLAGGGGRGFASWHGVEGGALTAGHVRDPSRCPEQHTLPSLLWNTWVVGVPPQGQWVPVPARQFPVQRRWWSPAAQHAAQRGQHGGRHLVVCLSSQTVQGRPRQRGHQGGGPGEGVEGREADPALRLAGGPGLLREALPGQVPERLGRCLWGKGGGCRGSGLSV